VSRRKKILLTVLAVLSGLGLIAAAFLAFTMFRVQHSGGKVYAINEIEAVPPHKYALLPGTSKMIGDRQNRCFTNRIEAAAMLYHAGKVKKIIVSGDNRKAGYNEPEDMRLALLDKGVPGEAILPDYAGFRTLDSVLRAKNVFGAESFIVVSQDF